ncbi:unnamed protein product [Prunus armeniaca]|uniref:RING-type E3 ubiquitin transferase n=1 Tax=Prunus armeniaca TaxID=36596 RepID=A0A6J5W704_PRUAR|nr:unnamed protein product [Prunus armeniaca]
MAPVALFIFSLLIHLVVLHSTEEVKINKRCPPYYCHAMAGDIGFPFKSQMQPPECGLFTVNCSDKDHPRIQLIKEGYWHEFHIVPQSDMIIIDDEALQQRLKNDSCNDQLFNDLSLPRPSPIFDELFPRNLTLFKCNNTPVHNTDLKYGCRNPNHTYYTTSPDDSLPSLPPSCSIIRVPMDPKAAFDLSALITRFDLQFQVSEECKGCYERKGECQDDKGKFKCSGGEKGDKLGFKLGLERKSNQSQVPLNRGLLF